MTSLHDIVARLGRSIGTAPFAPRGLQASFEQPPYETPCIADLISRIDAALSARTRH